MTYDELLENWDQHADISFSDFVHIAYTLFW